MDEFLDPEAVAIPRGAMAEGMRDALAGDDTPHAEAFRNAFVHILHRVNVRAMKG